MPSLVGSSSPQSKDQWLRDLYAAVAPAPDTTYGTVLPIAMQKDAQGKQHYHMALPSMLRDMAKGGVDLLAGTKTGVLTPDAMMTLMTMSPSSAGATLKAAPSIAGTMREVIDQPERLAYRENIQRIAEEARAKASVKEEIPDAKVSVKDVPIKSVVKNTAAKPDISEPGYVLYHGSPHDFDTFDPAKLLSTEGKAYQGHGFYLTDSPHYADQFATDKGFNKTSPNGVLYTVKLKAKPDEILDYSTASGITLGSKRWQEMDKALTDAGLYDKWQAHADALKEWNNWTSKYPYQNWRMMPDYLYKDAAAPDAQYAGPVSPLSQAAHEAVKDWIERASPQGKYWRAGKDIEPELFVQAARGATNSPQEALDVVRSAGIKAMRQTMDYSKFGTRDPKLGEFLQRDPRQTHFVVFDPKAISILNKAPRATGESWETLNPEQYGPQPVKDIIESSRGWRETNDPVQQGLFDSAYEEYKKRIADKYLPFQGKPGASKITPAMMSSKN